MADISQIEVNGTTYNICDATARDSLSQYLPLTGGELTGVTKMIGKYLYCKATNINRDKAAPSNAIYGNSRFTMQDSDNELLGEIRPIYQADGKISLQFAVWNESTSGDQVQNWMQLNVAKDGTQSYNISSPSAFRDALGDVPYTISGTTTTQSAMSNIRFSSQSSSSQLLRMFFTSYNNKEYAVILNTTGSPFVYNSTNSTPLYSFITSESSASTMENLINKWTSVTAANFFTVASGWTVESDSQIRVNSILGLAHIYLHLTRTTGNASADNETIGTIKSAYALQGGSTLASFTTVAPSLYLSGTTSIKANLAANTKAIFAGGVCKLA